MKLVSENQFSGKTYFYTIHPLSGSAAAAAAAEAGFSCGPTVGSAAAAAAILPAFSDDDVEGLVIDSSFIGC